MSPAPGWEFAGRTDIGCVRRGNEDSWVIDDELGLMIVADGMGGHNSGEVASALAVAIIRDYAQRTPLRAAVGGLSPRGWRLEHCIKAANAAINEKGRASAQYAGMGTTVVAVQVDADSLSVAHVGDSRLYLLRRGVLTQLTADHSLVADQARQGLITLAEAEHSPLQNILTRAVGTEADVQVDVAEHAVQAGDMILLASDGLTKMVADAEIARLLRAQPAPASGATALVERARREGGLDNITVICGRNRPSPAPGLWGKLNEIFRRGIEPPASRGARP